MIAFSEAEVRELLRREESLFPEFKSLWERGQPQRRMLERKAVSYFIVHNVAASAITKGRCALKTQAE